MISHNISIGDKIGINRKILLIFSKFINYLKLQLATLRAYAVILFHKTFKIHNI